jgi:uncharacterized coiled-coil protein SlyX
MAESLEVRHNVLKMLEALDNRLDVLEARVESVLLIATEQDQTLRRELFDMLIEQRTEIIRLTGELEKEKKDREKRRVRAIERLKSEL